MRAMLFGMLSLSPVLVTATRVDAQTIEVSKYLTLEIYDSNNNKIYDMNHYAIKPGAPEIPMPKQGEIIRCGTGANTTDCIVQSAETNYLFRYDKSGIDISQTLRLKQN